MRFTIILAALLTSALFCNVESREYQVESKPHLSHTWNIENGKSIFLFDEMIPVDKIFMLHSYFLYPNMKKIEFLHKNFEESMQYGLTPFKVMANKTDFVNFAVYKDAKSLIEKSINKEVHLVDAYAELLHSLDPKSPTEIKGCDKESFTATLFLTNDWRYNSYGQISFYALSYNQNVTEQPRLEIMQTVHPKPGRMIVWPSCMTYCHHPPSVNYFSNLIMLTMQFTTNKDKENNMQQEKAKTKFGDFKFTNKDADRDIDYKKHLKRAYFDSKKRGIYVFDDLFTVDELREWRGHLLNVGYPFVGNYDHNPLEDHDNVQWIAGFDVTEFTQTQVWKRVQEMLGFINKGKHDWYPYDVALNLVRPADHTRIHPDAERHQYEYTYLLYLTEGITQNDFGETVWFEQNRGKSDGIHEFTHPGGEEFDPIAAVWPKFGRVVIFRNIIEHSARPLGTSHLGCRYSFAVKVCVDKRKSMIKQMYEKMETLTELDDKSELNEEFQRGVHDKEENSPLTTKMIEDHFIEVNSLSDKFHLKTYADNMRELL